MAKKKKSIFRVRYLLILVIMCFLYRILVISLPIEKAHISYEREVTENKKNEIGNIVKKTGIGDLRSLRDSIESLTWVEVVDLRRNILSRLKIVVTPRVPVVRIAGAKDKVIDEEGFIFSDDRADSLPIVVLGKGVSGEEIAQALRILEILTALNIDKMRINRGDVITKCSNFEVIWGNDKFERKYEILKRILGDNISEFSGKIDFRFKNMVVLRR
ncbi:cell division protein FtsQ/DivIB [candidate division WOR-3 bacterium]|nr:cell division protein FtsQ/DivIB [candidate division WOR-3 bacterium]